MDYTFPWPTVCPGVTLTMAWSVWGYTYPSFLTLANGTDESTLTMNPVSASDIGMYTISLVFTPDGVAADALTTSFIVHVYPEVEYENL